MDPREMELPDAAYEGARLANDPRYGKPCGKTQLAKTLAVYDRADPAAARVVIVVGSDFEGTSPKLFWPETLIYSLPGAELNQMLTLVVAIKSEMPCEPELLLFAGMNDHLHAMGFLEQLKGDEPATLRPMRLCAFGRRHLTTPPLWACQSESHPRMHRQRKQIAPFARPYPTTQRGGHFFGLSA